MVYADGNDNEPLPDSIFSNIPLSPLARVLTGCDVSKKPRY